MFWLFQVELQFYFISKSLKKCKGLKIQICLPTGCWAIEKKLYKLELVCFRIDWWIAWTSYYEDLKVIQISREITENTKIQMWLFKKIFGPIVDTLYHRRLNCGVFQFFLSKFAMWNEPRSISLLKDLIKRQWLFNVYLLYC